jgi:hypothetical protein
MMQNLIAPILDFQRVTTPSASQTGIESANLPAKRQTGRPAPSSAGKPGARHGFRGMGIAGFGSYASKLQLFMNLSVLII